MRGREAEELTRPKQLVHLRLFKKLLDGCGVVGMEEQYQS